MNKKKFEIGLVFTSFDNFEYGLIAVFEGFVIVECLTGPCHRKKRIEYSFEELEVTFTPNDRRMTQEELKKYLSINPDPLCEFKPGIYYLTCSIYDFPSGKFIAEEDEIIKINSVEVFPNEITGKNWIMQLNFVRFGKTEVFSTDLSFDTKLELVRFLKSKFYPMHTETTWSMLR